MVLRLCSMILMPFLFTLLKSSPSNQPSEPCPLVGPDLFGDFRFHSGCRLDGRVFLEQAEDKMRPFHLLLTSSKMNPSKVPGWLDGLTSQLLKSTYLVNNLDFKEYNKTLTESCGGSCFFTQSKSPQCCQVETRLLYPMFGRSITSGNYVRIVQESDPNGVIQPIVYRHCRSHDTMLVKGRCRQSVLPRLVYVAGETPSGHPYRQDLIMMPNNCDCLVSLASSGSDSHREALRPGSGRSVVTSNMESSGEDPEGGSGQFTEDLVAQDEDFIL